jgi:hypothetical protein
MIEQETLIARHGGYRKLKSFQVAQLAYDVTVRFCGKYIDKQNIAEGSQASATSKKMELKLTQVARASLEELKLDYEDFLRHRGLAQWQRQNPLRQALIDRRCETADEVARWVVEAAKSGGPSGQSGRGEQDFERSTMSTMSPSSTQLYPELSVNAALTLLAVSCTYQATGSGRVRPANALICWAEECPGTTGPLPLSRSPGCGTGVTTPERCNDHIWNAVTEGSFSIYPMRFAALSTSYSSHEPTSFHEVRA